MTTTASWERSPIAGEAQRLPRSRQRYWMFGGVLVIVVLIATMITNTVSGARYFITVDTLLSDPSYVGQTVRITGAVVGETIAYDTRNLIIEFTIAAINEDTGDLSRELHNAVHDLNRTRLPIYIEGQVKPDLLEHEAQAILTGRLGEDGVFYASELLLKCPSRYGEAAPEGL